MKVLVVDSDLHSLHAIATALRQNGYEPLQASSYEEGRRLWIAEQPPMLVADVRLGQFNGLQLLLRARADRPDLTAIITCPFPDKTLENETRRFGGTFLVKPIEPEQILAAVRQSHSVTSEQTALERRREERRRMTIPGVYPDRRLFDRRAMPTNQSVGLQN